jgi:hypothetical protein
MLIFDIKNSYFNLVFWSYPDIKNRIVLNNSIRAFDWCMNCRSILSITGNTQTKLRTNLLPTQLENLTFLKLNR